MNTSYLKSKADQYEVYHVKTEELNAEVTNGKTDFATEGATETIAITVIKDRKRGFAFTNDPRKFKQTADQAIRTALANNKDKDLKGFAGKQAVKKIKNFDSSLLSYTLKDFEKLKNTFLKELSSANNKIMLSSASYDRTIETVSIENSEGIDLKEKAAMNTMSYDLTLKNGADILATSGAKADVKPIKPGFGKEEAKRILSLKGRHPVKTAEYQAIFHPNVTAELLSKAFIPNISAENTQQKRSSLLGKINKKIMSDKITITDDATTKGLLATSSFDCEGTPSQKNTLINKGMLKTYLHNNYTAKKEGKKSTGNAARSPTSLPTISSNNVIMMPGKDKDLLSGIAKGVYIREVMGVHTMNSLTGDFSLALLEGHYIEDGKIKHPINNAMISGNLYDLLNKVQSVGDKTIHAYAGAYYLPEISFQKLKVIGKN